MPLHSWLNNITVSTNEYISVTMHFATLLFWIDCHLYNLLPLVHNKYKFLHSTTTVFFFYLLDEKPLWCDGLCVCMQRKMCPTYPPVMKCIETHTDRIYYTRDVFATRHVFHFVGISKNKTPKNQTNWKQHLIIQSQLDPKPLFHHK